MSFFHYIFIHCFLLTQTLGYQVISKNTVIINISGNRCTSIRWKFSTLNRPRILLLRSTIRFSSITFCIIAFTVLYAHNQHTHVTSVRLCKCTLFQKWRSFICVISAPIRTIIIQCTKISSRDPHQYQTFIFGSWVLVAECYHHVETILST